MRLVREFAMVAMLGMAAAACGGEEAAPAPAPIALTGAAPSSPGNDEVARQVAASWETDPPVVAVYKTPTCGCCQDWVEHIEAAGFETEVLDLNDLSTVKQQHGIPYELSSCHTAVVGGYFVEGHVPADLIAQLLRERPDIAGITVPGMPRGSPGMEVGFVKDRYDVIAIGKDGARSVYASR